MFYASHMYISSVPAVRFWAALSLYMYWQWYVSFRPTTQTGSWNLYIVVTCLSTSAIVIYRYVGCYIIDFFADWRKSPRPCRQLWHLSYISREIIFLGPVPDTRVTFRARERRELTLSNIPLTGELETSIHICICCTEYDTKQSREQQQYNVSRQSYWSVMQPAS